MATKTPKNNQNKIQNTIFLIKLMKSELEKKKKKKTDPFGLHVIGERMRTSGGGEASSGG